MIFIQILLYIIAVMLAFPPLATWVVYKAAKVKSGNQRVAVHQATYWTAFLYIISVTYIISMIFHIHAAGYMIGFILLFLMLLLFLQYKYTGEIVFRKLLKLFLRAAFLLFFCLYILGAVAGIAIRILF